MLVQRALGGSIRRYRLAAGLRQEDAAELAGIGWRYWQEIEAGRVNVTLSTIVRIADALGVSFWDLVARSE